MLHLATPLIIRLASAKHDAIDAPEWVAQARLGAGEGRGGGLPAGSTIMQ